MNKLLLHETLDKLFIKQKTLKSPSLNYRSLNHHFNNQLSKRNENITYDSNNNNNNILKTLTSNSNVTPFHYSKQNSFQNNIHIKRPSINIYKQEDEYKVHNNKNILTQPQPHHYRQSLRHSQQYLIQVLNTNTNTLNIISSQSCSNLNTNNNLSTNESSHPIQHASKKKINSPHIKHHLKLQHQPSLKEIINYTPNIQNYHSRLRASVSSYCLSPAVVSTKHPIHSNNNILLYTQGKKCTNSKRVSYEVESNLNEVQFLRPDIPLRKFVSKWEPIDMFEVENVVMFSNYGNQDVGDVNMKSIINNIIITSSGNNKGEGETERKGKQLQSRSINSNNENVQSKVNLQTYGSVNEMQQKQQKQKKKIKHKKKRKLLCCI